MTHKILIVEDEDIIRNALKKLLVKHDYQVDAAASIAEARQYRFDDFDLVISDLRLPGGQGTDLIDANASTPVLIMTSYASMRSAVDAMKMGAVDYIAKPFDHKEMIATVRSILGQTAATEEISAADQDPESTAISQQADDTKKQTQNKQTHQHQKPDNQEHSKESLDEYFVRFVQENEKQMNETELARQLGISRKSLWERRNKLGIPRKK